MDFNTIVEFAKNGLTMPKTSSQSEFLTHVTITGILGNWRLGLITSLRALEEREWAKSLFEEAKEEERRRFEVYRAYNRNMIRAGELIYAANQANGMPEVDKDRVICLLMEATQRMGGVLR